MASIYLRNNTYWLQFYHPVSGELLRHSLKTSDTAYAELAKEKADLLVKLADPRIKEFKLPASVNEALEISRPPVCTIPEASPVPTQAPAPPLTSPPLTLPAKECSISEALDTYIRFIKTDNDPDYVLNKLSILRKFFGDEAINHFVPLKTKPKSAREKFYKGSSLNGITTAILQQFIDGQNVSTKTKKHYKEVLHHFFEICLKYDVYIPTNFAKPNPASALPSYREKNRVIVYLRESDVHKQLEVLQNYPALKAAVILMIHGGLRRAEVLWLRKENIHMAKNYMRIANLEDEETKEENSLKTGERSITILPQLREFLTQYLSTVNSEWIIPSSIGGPWRGDAFYTALKEVNTQHGLKWTCYHYRHTYATNRVQKDEWSLSRVAAEMGNSIAVVEEYYAAFADPSKAHWS